jgi:hemolysin activation/secretion protein
MFRGGWILLAMGMAIGAHAQTPADIERARQQADQIQQRERELERQRRELEDQRRRTPSGQALEPRPRPAPAAPGAACRTIAEIVLDGATKLDELEQARLAAPYLGRCLGLADVNRLLADLTNRYVELGYVTTRVYIPEQDLSGGRLLLKIVEGRVQSLRVEPAQSASAATAFPGVAGQVLNLRDLEQGIDQVNRLASNAAKIDIQPGDEPGASHVVVRNEPRRRWTASASADNSGSESTGRTVVSAQLGADHLYGANEYFSVNARGSRKSGGEYTESVGGLASLPWGYWTFSASASRFRYASRVQGTVSTFSTAGDSDTRALRAERVLYRDQAAKWSVGGGYTGKRTRNSIAGLRIDTSSADLAVADLSTTLSVIHGSSILSFDLGWAQGLEGLGATRDDPARPPGAPQAQFGKLTLGASIARQFTAAERTFTWRSALSAQHSADALYGGEQIAIGNLYTVRGFQTTSFSGRSGFYVRNDLGVHLAPGVRPYAAYDFGNVEGGGTLHGWAAGVDFAFAGAALQITYAAPIAVPDGMRKESGWVYARLAYTY